MQTVIESGRVPDFALRAGIRRLLGRRLRELETECGADPAAALQAFATRMRASPIATHVREANAQHYEVPAEFYRLCLGPQLKYSSALFGEGVETLAAAEEAMLRTTCERAELENGQRVLELGCGWGSLSLWMAAHYPASRILALSNSASQRAWIEARARERGLENLEVVTCDVNAFQTQRRFDRVVSVEMFEHMRNWEALLERIGSWLDERGRLFVHIFTHKRFAYEFEVEGEDNWLGRNFFTGGIMPAEGLFGCFGRDLRVLRNWSVDGSHYGRTAECWLANLDRQRAQALRVLAAVHGEKRAAAWLENWRVFFMACAELWNYRDGSEWGVTHYLCERAGARS
ncbi:MAG: class I SAM-dependent methyltransferase [Planctomycetes bacterium]|nr:class I SAM-dependent methyltransferase [Planctomycetota bacterium]